VLSTATASAFDSNGKCFRQQRQMLSTATANAFNSNGKCALIAGGDHFVGFWTLRVFEVALGSMPAAAFVALATSDVRSTFVGFWTLRVF